MIVEVCSVMPDDTHRTSARERPNEEPLLRKHATTVEDEGRDTHREEVVEEADTSASN